MLGDHGSSPVGQDQDKMERPAKRKNLIESTRLFQCHTESALSHSHNGAHTRDPLGSSSPWDPVRGDPEKREKIRGRFSAWECGHCGFTHRGPSLIAR